MEKLVKASPIIIVLLFAFFLMNKDNSEKPIPAAYAQTIPDTPVPTSTPVATKEMVLNSTTATAIAPYYPTITPTPEPTLIPDSFAPGGENDAIFSLWFGRIIGLIVLCGLAWVAYLIYSLNMYKVEMETELKKAEIEAMTKLKINPRPILSTNVIKNDETGDRIKLSNGQEVAKNLIIEFLKSVFDDSDEKGLAVSRWKSNGWTQVDIEAVLDHLAEASMITKRQTGRACEWLVVPDRGILCRQVFRISPYELED